jgi:lipopolysaccharide export system permease protein
MNIFQRLLLKSFLLNLARSTAVLGLVIAGLAFPDISANWPGTAAPSLEVVSYVLVQLIVVLDKILPMALLVATLFTVGPLARYQELTALSSAGWSLLRIMRPLVLVALVAVVYSAGVRIFGVVSAVDPVYGPSALAE